MGRLINFLLVLIVITSLTLFSGCVGNSKEVSEKVSGNVSEKVSEKVVTIAVGAEPTTLKTTGGYYDMPKVYSSLIRSDENQKPIPDLAESWAIDNEKKTITFIIRNDVKWHDGSPFSAEDVKYTFDTVRDERNIAVFTSATTDLRILDRIDIVDRNTVVFVFDDMPASALTYFAMPILPKHILQNEDLNTTGYWLHPIGTGPYLLDRWVPRQELVYKANEDYYGKIPDIDVLKFIFIPEESTRMTMLSSGEIQATKISPKLERVLSVSGYNLYLQPSSCWYGLSVPNQKWPFDIPEVRQAIAYAANKQSMIDALFNGKGEVAYGPYNSRDSFYNPEIAFSYDPDHAKDLLKEAGFVLKDDNWIYQEDGRILEFDLYYVASNPERKDIAIALATDLNALHIKVNLVSMTSWAEFDAEVARKTANILSWGSPNDPDIPNYKLFSSKFINDGWWNTFAYSNPRVDTLLESGRYERDPDARKTYYYEAQKIIAQEQPVIFLVYLDSVYLIDERIEGIKPKNSPHGSGTIGGTISEIWWNAQDWTYQV
ncbi:MAG: ABC transporter substrate-binding protein [Methanosarcinaceae archaeon]|nr:ABC transporter substrate-binding protein [Methanosarcinaceae archaeon]MDD4497755.1 ABC transporter substrate-binding protein [Methanosarcinaceae archaeon]